MMKRPVIYIAGPECFMPDGKEMSKKAVELCREKGFDAISPALGLEGEEPIDFSAGRKNAGVQIFRRNIEYIDKCDIVIANVNNFRGWEPDGGTCFEIGYAYTQGKKIYGFMDDTRPCYEKYIGGIYQDGAFWRDEQGAFFESGCMNLMVSGHAVIVEGGFERALERAEKDLEV